MAGWVGAQVGVGWGGGGCRSLARLYARVPARAHLRACVRARVCMRACVRARVCVRARARVHVCVRARARARARVCDDINEMPFTTLLYAQIAEWYKAFHLCHQNCNPGGPNDCSSQVTASGGLSFQADNSMGYTRIFARAVLNPGPQITVLIT